MTTLIGIKANKGEKGVILGSDVSRTHTNWQPHGDIAYRQQTKSEGQKIYINDNKTAALCMSGIYDEPYKGFLSDFLDCKFNLGEIIQKGFFEEFANLNLKRWKGKVPNSEYINGLLMSTRIGEPKLYTCWPLGKVKERAWTAVGSGSDYALHYISEQKELIPKRITIGQGIDISVKALDKASTDIYTGGLDLVVVTQEDIYDFGKQIRDKINKAKVEEVEVIKSKFK